ncbi:NADH dehydrogenase [ubiquinone] 1 beta subcomplex subunit 10 [Trichinella spiralis]|uniref:NADH dehydrogenase [ubiquinone] 1 beta subcomplex subunit 10 n=1 Tax=Trichinella spiralis TaxID=6334 RepID=UPI0001EFBC88|nr:NADH dehydrogenase [ubiquinone] 1 beta subcomplex subunit 10 [Trichinella spiralis]
MSSTLMRLDFKQLPQKSLTMPGEACKGGSFSKERLTILLAANAAGEKLVPLVIGKTAYPRAFRDARVDVSKLPVTWKYSKSTWMSAEIFVEWLKAVNATMRQQHRKILLLLDNAPSHLNVELSNVKLEFLPAKSTSCLQPMDLGVLRQFKCKYRSHLLQSLLANAETYEHAYKFFSRITVLDAVCWISQSWNEVESEKYFKNMASGETLAERYKREDKEISKAFWEVLDINSRGTILLRFKYYVWRMLDIPATWMKENIVDPLQKDRKMPYYHRRFNRVRTIDECAVDDRVCYEEAQMQYHLDKMVDGYILDILRNRMQRCREYYMNNAEYKCAKCIDDFEQAELNFYIKYGDMGYYGDVLTAYTKQKHRMIWERRHPEIMAARAEAHEEHKRQMELGNYDPSFWKRKDPRLYKDYVISIFTPYNYSSFLRFKRDEPSQDPKFYTEREEARQKGEYKEPANPNLIWP